MNELCKFAAHPTWPGQRHRLRLDSDFEILSAEGRSSGTTTPVGSVAARVRMASNRNFSDQALHDRGEADRLPLIDRPPPPISPLEDAHIGVIKHPWNRR